MTALCLSKRSVLPLVLFVLALSAQAATVQESLQAGYSALDAGNLDTAKAIFTQVAAEYSETPQAAEAVWKLGYIAIKQKDDSLGKSHFQRVADSYPSSPKAPDALLRLAYLASKGKSPETRNAFLEVARRYPDTPEAQLAKFRLARL